MRRRHVLGLIGAAVWPHAARPQHPDMPVIGFLRSTPEAPFSHLLPAFRRGLGEAGFVEGCNVAISSAGLTTGPIGKTAAALDLDIPATLLARPDVVID